MGGEELTGLDSQHGRDGLEREGNVAGGPNPRLPSRA